MATPIVRQPPPFTRQPPQVPTPAQLAGGSAPATPQATKAQAAQAAQSAQATTAVKSFVNADGTLDLTGAISAGVPLATIQQAGYGVTADQYSQLKTQISTYNTQLATFKQQLSTEPQVLQDAYNSGGIDAYNKAVDAYNAQGAASGAAQEADYQKQLAAYNAQIKPLDPDLVAKEQELQAAVDYASKIQSGEIHLNQEDISPTFWSDVENDKAQLALLQEAQRVSTMAPLPTDYIQYVRAATSPFATVSKEGYSIDLNNAVINTPVATLKSYGFTDADIDKATTENAISRIHDLPAAIVAGQLPLLQHAVDVGALDPNTLVDAQLAVASRTDTSRAASATASLNNFIDPKTGQLDLVGAVGAGFTDYDMRQAGFNVQPSDVVKVKAEIDAYNAQVAAQNAAIAKQNAALAQLKNYATPVSNLNYSEAFPDTDTGFNLNANNVNVGGAAAGVSGVVTGSYNLAQFLVDAKAKDAAVPQLNVPGSTAASYTVNYDKAIQTLKDAGFTQAQIQQVVNGITIPQSTLKVGPGVGFLGIKKAASTAEFNMQQWLADMSSRLSPGYLEPNTRYVQPGVIKQVASGALMSILSMAASIPMLVAQVSKNPTSTPKIIVNSVEGMAKSVATNVETLAAGGYATPYDMAFNTTTSIVIVYGAAEGLEDTLGKLTTYIDSSGINASALAKELSTSRIQLQEGLDVPMRDAMTKALQAAMSKDSDFTGTIPIEGTSLKLKYLKSPIQQMVGNLLFHGATDGLDFLKSQIKVEVFDGSTTIDVNIPLSKDITTDLLKLKTYSNQAIADLDTPQIRALNIDDATDIPSQLAKPIQDYVQAHNGVIYGSFVDWIKNAVASRPHDVDVVFPTDAAAADARDYISQQAQQAGFKVRVNDRGVQIPVNGQWTTIANVVSESQHADMISAGNYVGKTVMSSEGVLTETTGTQIANQALGSLSESAKAATRAGKVVTAAPHIVAIAEAEGVPTSGVATFRAGPAGLYTDPWAAFQYTRGGIEITADNIANYIGDNPGIKIGDTIKGKPALVMVITDPSFVNTASVTEFTQSDAFIRGASEGAYGPSKIYKGDFESEIVLSPNTKLQVPLKTASLSTRVLAGDFADFYTFDNGEFVPIKLAVDSKLLESGAVHIPTAAELYGAKLMTFQNALRDTSQAFLHPGAMLSDIGRTLQHLVDPETLFGESGSGSTSFPGVRDIYLETDWGLKIKDWIDKITNQANNATQAQAALSGGVSPANFAKMFDTNLTDAYRANAAALLANARNIAAAYSTTPEVHQAFETDYVARLGPTIEALFKHEAVATQTMTTSLKSVESDIKATPSATITASSVTQVPSEAVAIPTSTTSEPVTASALSLAPAKAVSEVVVSSPKSVLSLEPLVSRESVPVSNEPRSITSSEESPTEERPSVSEVRSPVTESEEPTTESSSISSDEYPPTEESPRSIEERVPSEEERSTSEETRSVPPVERYVPPDERRYPSEERRPPPSERRPPVEERRVVSKIKVPVLLPDEESKKEEEEIPLGSIAWRQGKLFGKEEIKYIPPPFNEPKPLTLLGKRPRGWVEKGITPQETLQIIGQRDARIPKTLSFNLGVVDGFIDTDAMTINFTGGGLKTDVGKLGNTTTGMSVPGIRPVPVEKATSQKRAAEQRKMTTETVPAKTLKKQLADLDAQSALSEIL